MRLHKRNLPHCMSCDLKLNSVEIENWSLHQDFFFAVIFGIRQKPVSHLVKKNRKSLRRLLFSTIDDVTSFGLEKSAHEIDSSNWKWYGMLGRGGLISESFSLWLKSPNKGAKSLSWALCTTKEKVLSKVSWHLCLEIWARVKNFLRLRHL